MLSHRNVESTQLCAQGNVVVYANDVDLLLAERPPDDDEPVTEEWLLSVGFNDRGVGEFVRDSLLVTRSPRYGWLYSVGAGSRLGNGNMTRDDVRRLLEALGVELNEPK